MNDSEPLPPAANPYAAPIDGQAPSLGSTVLPETSVLLMLLLSFVTVGMYVPHWMYTRGTIVNRVARQPLVSIGAIGALYALFAVSTLLTLASLAVALMGTDMDVGALEASANVLDKVANIAMVFACFHFRRGLHQLQRRNSNDFTWLNGAATFFFGVFYFQYKLNRGLLDPSLLEPTGAS